MSKLYGRCFASRSVLPKVFQPPYNHLNARSLTRLGNFSLTNACTIATAKTTTTTNIQSLSYQRLTVPVHVFSRHHSTKESGETDPETPPDKARLLIGFTCKVCNHRQYKTMSRLAYTKGVVLMQCDGCKNRHLIADHLGWFRDKGATIEDIIQEKGEDVRKMKGVDLLDSMEAEEVKKALKDHLESRSKSKEPLSAHSGPENKE